MFYNDEIEVGSDTTQMPNHPRVQNNSHIIVFLKQKADSVIHAASCPGHHGCFVYIF